MENEKNVWFLFIMSQPGKSATPRIRLWRLLKGLGAAVLRDGVYLLPHRETLQQALEEQVHGVQTLGGTAYRGKLWATRQRVWVDRVASAWLIRRFIDPEARFVWIQTPQDCPADAIGFDFDGAAFTHTEHRVTFEVLLASFDLATDPALTRLGVLVHSLDVGGVPVPEAAGFEAMLTGVRASCADDDQVLAAMIP